MSFTEEETAYIQSQRLARVATVDGDGQPDVVPVGFAFDGTYFYVGGFAPERTRRHHNVRNGHTKVALVIDDVASVQPWAPRFLRVYGTADLVEYNGGPHMRIKPEKSWSWNLAGQPFTHETSSGPNRTAH
jgi:pyridoxamine 5'-phosphate oxidase family protein